MASNSKDKSRKRGSWIGWRPRRDSHSRERSSFDNPNAEQSAASSSPCPSPSLSSSFQSSSSFDAAETTNPLSRTFSEPTTPAHLKRFLPASPLLSSFSPKAEPTIPEVDGEAGILSPLERADSANPLSSSLTRKDIHRSSSSFGRMALTSMIGGLSSLSLSRNGTNTSMSSSYADDEDKELRGRRADKGIKISRSLSANPASDRRADEWSGGSSLPRSQSPFNFRRFRTREVSPVPQPLALTPSDAEDAGPLSPHLNQRDDVESGDETETVPDDASDDASSDEEPFDPVTERNTEKNALIPPVDGDMLSCDQDADIEPDPTGEGVNVVVPPEPYFPSTLNYSAASSSQRGKRNPKRRKSTRHHVPLHLTTGRSVFQRDRCTITITQGDPETKLDGRRKRRYVVASDLSDESRYAVEWGIGTVLRDGDEMLIVTILENESRVDPPVPNPAERLLKLRGQQERQGLAYILVRQATSLLQRTKLNVTIQCQAWHAKNARHILLDVVDYYEPSMLIVGSRGLSQLKGILLGSTSYYLIQKCSVPVMVARRRLRRPPRRSAHLTKNRTHISLAEAAIDRVAPKVDQDVKGMLHEIEREGSSKEKDSFVTEFEEPEEAEGEDDLTNEVSSPQVG